MKTLKLLLMIAALPAMIFLTTNCNPPADSSDFTIKRLKKCLDNCDEKRDRIDADFQECIDELSSQMALYERQMRICERKYRENRDDASYIRCIRNAWSNFPSDKLAECILDWKEGIEEVEKCKELCYKNAVNRKLP